MHPDLKIKAPRGSRGLLKNRSRDYWDLVRAHGTSRKKMVDFICSIGGYHTRDITSAISFNIKAYHADLSVEHLWKMLTSGKMDCGPDHKLPPEHMARAKALFWRVHKEYEDHLWEWGCEEAYEGWRDSDTPYETFAGERVEWRMEVHGRGSGHLCMTECAGLGLECPSDELRSSMNDEECGITHAQVRKLFIICVQNSVDLTPRKVSDEVEYHAAWRLWVSFCENELKDEIAEYETRAELSDDADSIYGMLTDVSMMQPDDYPYSERERLSEAFKAICKLADVKIGE